MLALLLAIALTDSQQAIHDSVERAMRAELVSAREIIDMEWKPNKRTVKDYDRAEKCYAAFHLYKAKGCDANLDVLHRDVSEEQAREEALRK